MNTVDINSVRSISIINVNGMDTSPSDCYSEHLMMKRNSH